MLRGLAADVEEVWTHVCGLFAGLEPPAPDSPLATAHSFAAELDRRVAAFAGWIDSPGFPAAVRSRRAEFRLGAERLAVAARRLSAATGRRRVDELIERATEALDQASRLLNLAMEGVLRDVALRLDQLHLPGEPRPEPGTTG
jgi:hypothetical protein